MGPRVKSPQERPTRQHSGQRPLPISSLLRKFPPCRSSQLKIQQAYFRTISSGFSFTTLHSWQHSKRFWGMFLCELRLRRALSLFLSFFPSGCGEGGDPLSGLHCPARVGPDWSLQSLGALSLSLSLSVSFFRSGYGERGCPPLRASLPSPCWACSVTTPLVVPDHQDLRLGDKPLYMPYFGCP